MVKLREVVTYRKQFIEIDDQETYKRCRVQLHRRGVKLRDIILGSNIKTKKQRLCKSDDFIVAEMDAKFGGYGIIPEELHGAIVSSHYYLYELDQSKLLPAFLTVIIDSGVFDEQIKAVGSTNYSRISAKEILEYEIPCPSLDDQRSIIDFYFNSKEKCSDLGTEFVYQQALLKKLRQQILQEAIEGKLTADWREQNPDVEPASELLVRIKAEKEQLIKDKKIKKQKALPPIIDEEKPFNLPDGWEWCNVGNFCTKVTDGFHNTPKKLNAGKIYISATHIRETGINWDKCLYVSQQDHEELYKKAYPQKGEILITNRGAGCATPVIIDINEEFSFQNAALIGFNQALISNKYVFYNILKMRDEIMEVFVNGGLQPMLSNVRLGSIPIPFPPILEQKAIVTKLESLFAICDQLETKITNNQTHADQLMQAVLKEAFQHQEKCLC